MKVESYGELESRLRVTVPTCFVIAWQPVWSMKVFPSNRRALDLCKANRAREPLATPTYGPYFT